MSDLSAADLVANPELGIDPITATTSAKQTGYDDDELAHFRIGKDDLQSIVATIYNFGEKQQDIKRSLRRILTDAVSEDSIDATPTFTLTMHDPDWEIINSGALDHTIDINPGKTPHRWYRLSGFAVNDDDITLTFSTRNAMFLMKQRRPRKSNRKKVTRARFILTLVRSVKDTKIHFFSPQLDKKQKIKPTEFSSEKKRKNHREKGFSDSDKITAKHNPTDKHQRTTIEKVIAAGLDVDAPTLVIISAVMCVIQESVAGKITGGNPPYVGPFQQNRAMGWPATGDAYKDAKGYYSHAIPLYKKNPNGDLGVLVANVQGVTGSTNPLNFGFAQSANKWRDEAQHAVKAYTGFEVGAGTSDTIEFKKKYEFQVPEEGLEHENYLTAIYRLAKEVNWSAYWVRDVLHYQSQEDLFKSKARARIRRFNDGVEGVSFEWQKGKRLNTMTLNVRMERWVAPIGTVVVFDEGGPGEGRWLVTNIRRSMFDELGEITLSKPMREYREPANEPDSRTQNTGRGGPGGTGSPGDASLAGGTLADIKTSWTAKQVIDRIVIPKARFHGMLLGISPQQVVQRNASHGGTSATTWHKGPSSLQWAADMSVGTSYPTEKMDNLAFDLIESFQIDMLANPLATNKDGNVPGNLIDGYHKGFHFQLIYRTNLPQGGDHYNHVHFGVKREQPFPNRAGQRFPP